MRSIRPDQVVKQLTNSSYLRVKPNGATQRVSTRYLGYLVLESLCSYRENPATFGRDARSLNFAMKRFIGDNVLSGAAGRQRLERLDRIVDAYKAPLGARTRIARTRVGNATLPRYLGRKAQAIFANSVHDLQRQQLGTQRMIPVGVTLPEATGLDHRVCRCLQGRLTALHCDKKSEAGADELYLMTGAMLADETGIWERVTHGPSVPFSNAGDNQPVPLPDSLQWLYNWKIQNPSDSYSLAPVTAFCDVTLMEKDHSDRQRTYAAFRAAYETASLLATVGGTGPVGFAIALVSILVSLLVALDGDDHLGTASFRFDDILADNIQENIVSQEDFKGPVDDSDYHYTATVHHKNTGYDCPVDPPFYIRGPSQRTMRDAGTPAQGGYALKCPASVTNIQWSVTPAGAIVSNQGQRCTRIKFHHSGQFKVAVSAELPGQGQIVDDHNVAVTVLDNASR